MESNNVKVCRHEMNASTETGTLSNEIQGRITLRGKLYNCFVVRVCCDLNTRNFWMSFCRFSHLQNPQANSPSAQRFNDFNSSRLQQLRADPIDEEEDRNGPVEQATIDFVDDNLAVGNHEEQEGQEQEEAKTAETAAASDASGMEQPG